MMNLRNRPFTNAVNKLRASGLRFTDLQSRSRDARSTAWFNKLCNSDDPWVVSPPGREQFAGLTLLFKVSELELCAWIAEEWYAIYDKKLPRAKQLGASLQLLSEDAYERIAGLVNELANFEQDRLLREVTADSDL